jgi:hypothetical protein
MGIKSGGIKEIKSDETKEWWIKGRRHRIYGPAIEKNSGQKEWWINGKRQCLSDGRLI